MRIIEEGYPEWMPWWVGFRVFCKKCGRIIELEKQDIEDVLDFGDKAYIVCKRCSNELVIMNW